MFDPNKEYRVAAYDLSFMVIDEADNVLSHPDGKTMEFTIPNYNLEYLADGAEVDELVLRPPEPDYLNQALWHLATVCDHANEDCPEEYRTKWFNPALEEAYSFLQKMNVKEVSA
jgi:hypothetical protein